MLSGRVADFLPGITSVEDGVKVYNGFNFFKVGVAKNGCIALGLLHDDEARMCTYMCMYVCIYTCAYTGWDVVHTCCSDKVLSHMARPWPMLG